MKYYFIILICLITLSCSSQQEQKNGVVYVKQGDTGTASGMNTTFIVEAPDISSGMDEVVIKVNSLQEELARYYSAKDKDTLHMLELAKESFKLMREGEYSFGIYFIYNMLGNKDSSYHYLNTSKWLLKEKLETSEACRYQYELKIYVQTLCLLGEKQEMQSFIDSIACTEPQAIEVINKAVKQYCE